MPQLQPRRRIVELEFLGFPDRPLVLEILPLRLERLIVIALRQGARFDRTGSGPGPRCASAAFPRLAPAGAVPGQDPLARSAAAQQHRLAWVDVQLVQLANLAPERRYG